MNEITLGNKSVFDPPAGGRETNSLCIYTGAARIGIGRFLMLRKDYTDLELDADGCVELSMSSDMLIGGSKEVVELVTKVVVAGAVPYSISTGADAQQKDFVEVYVYDMRYYLQAPKQIAINVQKDKFKDFYPSTLNSGNEYTWSGAITALELDGLNWPNLPTTWKPRNLIFNSVPKSRVADSIAQMLRLIIGYDPTVSDPVAGSLSDVLTAYEPGKVCDDNQALFDQYQDSLNASGADTDKSLVKLPGKYRVVFKGLNTDSSDLYANPVYQKDISAQGNPTNIYVIHVGEYVGLRANATWSNSSTLDTVAADIADRTDVLLQQASAEFTYYGWLPFQTDGYVRAIRWWQNGKGAFTTIRCNNDTDFYAIEDMRRTAQALSNQLIEGLGSTTVALGSSSTRLVWAPGSPTLANITAVSSGNFGFQSPAGQWIYTGDIIGGAANITLRNTFEITSYIGGKYRHGTGVEINPTTGKLTKGDCTIIPISVGVIVQCWPDPNSAGNWTFSAPNSAE